MIKKIISLVFLALLLSCNPKNSDDQFKIISTNYPYYLLSQELFGKHFSIQYLPAVMENNKLVFTLNEDHTELLEEADLIIINGLNLESQLDPQLESLKSRLFIASETIGENNYLSGDDGLNPFVWMNPVNILKTADALINKLESKTISFSTSVEQNYQYFKDLILKVDNEIRLERRRYENPAIYLTDSGLAYFLNEYKIQKKTISLKDKKPEDLKSSYDKSGANSLFISYNQAQIDKYTNLDINFVKLDIFGLAFEVQTLAELYRKNWNQIKQALN